MSQIGLLMKQDYWALAFLPYEAVERRVRNGEVCLQREGKEVYGYLLHSPVRAGMPVKVFQAMVDMDARRLKAGERMFAELVGKCLRAGATYIHLHCAEDLPSNLFWVAMGFRKVNTIYPPRKTRTRGINIYAFNLQRDIFTESDLWKVSGLVDIHGTPLFDRKATG